MYTVLIIIFSTIYANQNDRELLDSARNSRNQNPVESRELASTILKEAARESDSILMAEAYRLLGLIQSDLGDNKDAERYYLKSIRISEALDYEEGIRKAYNNLGVVQFEMGEYQESLNSHYKSLRLKQKSGDSLGISFSFSNLGLLHHKFKDYENAEDFFLQSIQIRERLNRPDLLSQIYNQLANLYFDMGLTDKATLYWDKSFVMNQEFPNSENQSENYLGFARVKIQEGDYNSAQQWVTKSIAISKQWGFKDELAASYNLMGEIYYQSKSLITALNYADSCRVLLELIFDKHLEWENNYLLANICYSKKDFANAFEYLRKANTSKEEEFSLALANNVYNSNLKEIENDKATEILFKDAEIDRREKAIIILVIGSALLAMFTLFVVILYRYTWKLNGALKVEKEKLKAKRDELSRYAKKLKDLVESKSESIYHKNMQLAGYAFLNAHKMRAPIATLLGLVNLSSHEKALDQETWLKEIRKNTIRLDRISKHINQILAEEMDLINDDKMKKYFASFKEIIEGFNDNDLGWPGKDQTSLF